MRAGRRGEKRRLRYPEGTLRVEGGMRGHNATQAFMLSPPTPDQLVPQGHPIREIKPIVERAPAALSPTFSAMYAENGRPSIPPSPEASGRAPPVKRRVQTRQG